MLEGEVTETRENEAGVTKQDEEKMKVCQSRC